MVTDGNVSDVEDSCSPSLGSERLPLTLGAACSKPQAQAPLHDYFSLFIANAGSIRKNGDELSVRVEQISPTIVCVCETWLEPKITHYNIMGYVKVPRRDRSDGPNCGGVTTYCKAEYCCIAHICDSNVAERSWHILHTHMGPILLC